MRDKAYLTLEPAKESNYQLTVAIRFIIFDVPVQFGGEKALPLTRKVRDPLSS
jgi:hypothetical protein